jgi:hypothetical protein
VAQQNILHRLENLKVRKVLIYPYAHLTSTPGSPRVALPILKGLQESRKVEQIEVKRAPFGLNKEFEIRGKGHPFTDLSGTICPHEGTECDITCPYWHHPFKEKDRNFPAGQSTEFYGKLRGSINI